MLLMIDNYDSFTFNLVQYFCELGEEVKVVRNDEITLDDIAALKPDRLVLSPGPCSPAEAGVCVPALQRFTGQLPILGVCLGHQSIGAAFGGKVVRAAEQMHGKTSVMTTTQQGVFAGLPSIEGFSKQHGVGMTVIKQGEIKDSGSMFRSMTPKERQVWQDLIDTSYNRFVAVVEEGRGKRLKRKLLEPFPVAPVRAGPNPPEVQPYQRYLADGGIYTAEKALEHGLVDSLGTLDDAVAEARKLADLDEHCKVVEYDRPRAPAELALGVRLPAALSAAFGPRLWALAPGHEAEAWLALAEAGAR